MIHKISLAKNEETFQLLDDFTSDFNKDRALNGLFLRVKTQQGCEEFADELRLKIAKAEFEQGRLKKLQDSYNFTFPTDDKNCLTTPHLLYNKVKNTISNIKKVVLMFCPKNVRKASGTSATSIQTLSHSYFCNKTYYSSDMFYDNYPECVHELLRLLEEYSTIATENIHICKEMIDQEKMIREDDDLLREIDMNCRKDYEEVASFLANAKLLSADGISKEDLERRRKNAKSLKEQRRESYHNISKKNYIVDIVKDFFIQGIDNELTPQEAAIWTAEKDYDCVKYKVRPAIERMKKMENLPSIKIRNSEGKQIKAEYIASFILWCEVPEKKRSLFLDYLNAQFANAPLSLPKYSSVAGALKNKSKKIQIKEYICKFDDYFKN